MQKTLIPALAAVTILASCGGQDTKTGAAPGPDILAAHLDTTISPATDFFSYANGGWIKANPIPDEYSSWGIAYLVQEDLYKRLETINKKAAEKPEGSTAKKIAAFWKSGMDTNAINKDGIAPLKALLTAIDGISDQAGLLDMAAMLNKKGVNVMMGTYVGQDAMNSEKMTFYLSQGGLGLPNRDYYFNTDERTAKIRAAYPGHISRMLMLTGLSQADADAKAAAIVRLETRLAKASRKLEDLRDPYKNYNKFAVGDIKTKLTPQIDWASWLKKIDVNGLDTLIVGQPEFLKELNATLQSEKTDTWKDYLKWQLISSYASYLSKDLEQEHFAFYGVLMSGAKKQLPRWKRVIDEEEEAMGEALGQLFVKEYFNEKAKKRYEDLVEDIRAALKERISKLDWMSDATKEKAQYKLAKMSKKVGYPDKWKDFSAMDIKEQPYAANVMAAREWWHQYSISKLGKPVDRTEWDMTPQTYNAYYNPSNNEIVLPAGIFTVPGLRDEQLDDALVYGYAAASTIGHEITHGFDDEGRQYDAAGNLKSWWTKEDEEKFNKRAAVMVQQFNSYNPIDKLHINGKATLGENIADLGGVLLGWDAFVKTEQYKKGEKIGGLMPAQRFFLGYALGWMYDARKESLARQLLTDVHSPAKYRVNGPFSDVDVFYQTFNIQPGDAMYIPDSLRVRIW